MGFYLSPVGFLSSNGILDGGFNSILLKWENIYVGEQTIQ
jgi:hypothetical protein